MCYLSPPVTILIEYPRMRISHTLTKKRLPPPFTFQKNSRVLSHIPSHNSYLLGAEYPANPRKITYFLRIFFRSMQGRDSYRLDLTTSIQEENTMFTVLYGFGKRYRFCRLPHFSISFLKRWLVCFTFFLNVCHF